MTVRDLQLHNQSIVFRHDTTPVSRHRPASHVHTLGLPASSPNTIITHKTKTYCFPPAKGFGPRAIFSRGRKEGLLAAWEPRTNKLHVKPLPCFVFLFLILHPKGKKKKVDKVAKFMISLWLDLVQDDAAV